MFAYGFRDFLIVPIGWTAIDYGRLRESMLVSVSAFEYPNGFCSSYSTYRLSRIVSVRKPLRDSNADIYSELIAQQKF
jgi:hypothetical protein